MMMKIIAGILLIVIIATLGHAMYQLVVERNHEDARHVVRSLTWRIGLSLLLFFLLILAYFFGWIHPHAV